jgi:hypothetical protein
VPDAAVLGNRVEGFWKDAIPNFRHAGRSGLPGTRETGAMGHEPGHGYDSFVVRLWRHAVTGTLLRAEVEHVQTGSVDSRVGPSWDWITAWLRDTDSQASAEPYEQGRD